MSFLLDTNTLSELRKPAGDPLVKRWIAPIPTDELFLSMLNVGEIRRGIERLRRHDAAQAAVFEVWLTSLRRNYSDRILPVTMEIAEEWARLTVPNPLPVIDGLLAATARVHGLTLVTRNTADFARTGVRLPNPFTPVP